MVSSTLSEAEDAVPKPTTETTVVSGEPPRPDTDVQKQRLAFARLSASIGDDRRGVAWFDAADGSTHLPVVGFSADEIVKLQSASQSQMATPLVVEPGDYSVAQLERVRDLVLARLQEFTTKSDSIKDGEGNRASAGLSTDRGKSFVTLQVTPSFEVKTREVLSTLKPSDLAGGDESIVQVTVSPISRSESWSGPSLDGGDWIRFVPHGACSFGWVMGPEPYWGISAGHCMGLNHLHDSLNWTNAAGDQYLQQIMYDAGYSSYTTASNNSVANDVSAWWVPYGAGNPYSYAVWSGLPRVRIGNSTFRTVRGVRTDEFNMVIGLQLCHSGWYSKAEKCGTITGQNIQDYQTFDSEAGVTRTMDGVYRINYTSGGGDSGGPVYWKWGAPYTGNAEPSGIHVASDVASGSAGARYFITMQDIEAMLGRYTVAQAA